MPSPRHAENPAHRPPDRSTLDDLIAQARRLRGGIDAVRPSSVGGDGAADDPRRRWERALCDLAAHHLDDLDGHLGRLREGAAPAPPRASREADEPRESDEHPRARCPDGTAASAYGPSGGRPAGAHRVGSADWNLLTDEVVWSDELYAIFGRRHQEGPLTLDDLPSYVVPEDQTHLTAAVTDCLVDGRPIDREFRIIRQDGPIRSVHMVGEPLLDSEGGTASMWAVFRDVSELRRSEHALTVLTEDRDPAVRQKQREEAEHRLARRLQESLLQPRSGPLGAGSQSTGTLDLASRRLPSAAGGRAGGAWYDAMHLPGGSTLLSAGDLTGYGPAAAFGMAVLLGAVRGMAVAGIPPAALMEHLNQMLDSAAQPTLAGALCCRYDPADRTLTWARAGHPAPLLFRGGTAQPLLPPEGVLLGVAPQSAYEERTERLEPGDILLLHTEGLALRATPSPGSGGAEGEDCGVERLLALAPRFAQARSAQECLRLVVEELGGADREDDACLLVARVGNPPGHGPQ